MSLVGAGVMRNGRRGKWGSVHFVAGVSTLVIVSLSLLALASMSSAAAPSRSYSSSFGSFTGLNPQGVAVDQASGDVYAADTSLGGVSRFTAAGAPDNFTAGPDAGTNTLTGMTFDLFGVGKAQVAIDNSTGPADGTVYIGDTVNNVVKVFSSTGAPLVTLTGSGSAAGSFTQPCGVAVDQATGDLYIADQSHRVWRYSPVPTGPIDAESDFEYTGGIDPGFLPCQLAADSGHVYVADYGIGAGGNLVRFRASDFKTGVPPLATGTAIDTTTKAVAVDPGTGDVYSDRGGLIAVYHAGGEAFYSFGSSAQFGNTSVGVAIKSGGSVYVSDRHTGGKQIDVYGPENFGHVVTVLKNGTGTVTSDIGGINCGATCSSIIADSSVVTFTATPEDGYTFSGWSINGSTSICPGTGTCQVTISADTTVTATFFKPNLKVFKAPSGEGTITSSPGGISCGTTCESLFDYGATVTLTPTPEAGSGFKEWGEGDCDEIVESIKCKVTLAADREVNAIFAAAPRITSESVRAHDTSARFEGMLDPESEVTKYRFQYVTETHYQQEGFLGAESVPAPAETLAAGAEPEAVTVTATKLLPATAYRFRLVAVNPLGEGQGQAISFATYPSEPADAECPNDEFRKGALAPADHPSARLSDCRAYEQASPVDKNGGTLQASIPITKASSIGDGVTFESGAGIPGGDGAQDFPIYMASRDEGGWSTRGLMPPASAGEIGVVLGWTPDFAQVFDRVRTNPGGPQALIARPRGGDPIDQLVPYTSPAPNYSITDLSADGSEVVFSAQGALTVKPGGPEPASGEENLYALDQSSGELSLVGVLPDGTVPIDGSSPIEGYAQEMHAVARDGSAFFTTGDPAQIYLRLHPTEPETAVVDGAGNCVPDPVLACTVAVSASQASIPDPDGPFEPTFRAATADGSSAFFTSPEELTDTAHTTAQVAIARANLDGSEVLSSFAPHADASAIAIDGEHVYWADPGSGGPGEGRIGRVDLNGENAEPDFITGGYNPQGVVVAAGHIYWTNAGEDENHNPENQFNTEDGSIGRATLNGPSGASEINQDFIQNASYPMGIDADSSYLYWANRGPEGALKTIARATLDSSEVTFNWFQSNATDVAVDVAHSNIYIARNIGEHIVRTGLTDPNTESEELPAVGAGQIAVDGDKIYWPRIVIENGNGVVGSIAQADLDGEGTDDFITAEEARGIAVDGTHVYWGSHPTPGTRGVDLYHYQVGSGELSDLTPDKADLLGAEVQGVVGAAEDGSYLYFVANGVLAPGASPGTCQESLGTCNLYVWHEDPETNEMSTVFIARLNAGHLNTGGDGDAWVSEPPSFFSQKTARVSPDGRTVIFSSVRELTDYDNEGNPEIYRYRVGEPGLVCVSCNPTGALPVGPAGLGSIEPAFVGASIQMNILSRNLSADGNRIFFETVDPLVAADTNGDEGCPGWGSLKQANHIKACQDVYEWEANGTGTCKSEAENGGCLYLLSTGKGVDAAFFADADESGDNPFIFSTAQLVSQDIDQLIDVYDVRVGGGLASQNETPLVPCEGEACKPPSTTPPVAGSPATPSFSGPGDPPVTRCPKGKVRRHGRCVRKRTRHGGGKSRRHKRHANTTRRAGK
jgi:hypothetical protein